MEGIVERLAPQPAAASSLSPGGRRPQYRQTADHCLGGLEECLVGGGGVRGVAGRGLEALEVSVGGATGAGASGGRDVRQRRWAAVWVMEAGGTVGGD